MSKIVQLHWLSNKHFAFAAFTSTFAIALVSSSVCLAVEPDRTVLDVLRKEAAGAEVDRAAELQSIASSQGDELAHWLSGDVFMAGKWVPVAELSDDALTPLMKNYLQQRGNEELTMVAHRKLAKWCESKGLTEQSRAHWNGVLHFDEQDIEARTRLGFQRFGNHWLSKKEIEFATNTNSKRLNDLKVWMPKMQQFAIAISGDDSKKKSKALAELRNLNEPGAVQAMFVAAMQLSGDYARPFVAAIRKFKTKEACLALAKLAIASPTSVAGTEAISGLMEYRQEFFVPDVLALIEDDAELQQTVVTRPNGDLVLEQALFHETMNEKSVQVLNKVIVFDQTKFARGSIRPQTSVRNIGNLILTSSTTFVLPEENQVARDIAVRNVELQKEKNKDSLASLNDSKKEFRERVIYVLKQTTGADPGSTSNAWWLWWDKENDTNRSSTKKYSTDFRESYEEVAYDRRTVPVQRSFVDSRRHECLVSGTQIQTSLGLRAIDSIRIGDLVLSSDVDSGALALRPVIKTTTRPPTDTMKIITENETIQATLGHYWWVAGHGWLRTRELAAGMQLHTATGTTRIDDIQSVEEPAPTYNLIVEGHHTYFVGSNRILSNDATDIRATFMKVPGLSTDSTSEKSVASVGK